VLLEGGTVKTDAKAEAGVLRGEEKRGLRVSQWVLIKKANTPCEIRGPRDRRAHAIASFVTRSRS
jgi:hypothetical protein